MPGTGSQRAVPKKRASNRGANLRGRGNWIAMKSVEARRRRAKLRWAQASASEVGATDLADGTCGDVDVDRSGAGGVKLRGVDDSVEEEEEALAPASSAPTMTSVRRSSRIRDRSRSRRRARLVSDGKGMFVGVLRKVQQKHFCKGIDCRFSYKNIGEKADVVGYCLWCDSDKMQKAMECGMARARVPKKDYSFFMTMTTMYFVWRLHDCLCSIVSIGH